MGDPASREGTHSRSTPPRCQGDCGFVAGAEGMLFGVVVFVFGLLLLFNAWAVIDTKMAVTSAARETTRTFVESDGSETSAIQAGRDAFAATSNFDVSGLSAPLIEGEFRRCGRIIVTYDYTVPAISLPGGFGWGDGFDVTASHTEIVDPFRSGLDGEAICDAP